MKKTELTKEQASEKYKEKDLEERLSNETIKKIINLGRFLLIIIVGFLLFTEIPNEVKTEALRVSLTPPVVFIWMFLLLIGIILIVRISAAPWDKYDNLLKKIFGDF